VFDSLAAVTFDRLKKTCAVEMVANDGEVVHFTKEVELKGNVEDYLADVVRTMQVCMYVVFMYVCMVCVCMYVCCVYVYCVYVCMYVVCVCMYVVCMYVCMYEMMANDGEVVHFTKEVELKGNVEDYLADVVRTMQVCMYVVFMYVCCVYVCIHTYICTGDRS
jgi:hypothetical protein